MYTFETLLHQELGKGPTKEELCKSIQRILERVLKVSGLARAPSLGWYRICCPYGRRHGPPCTGKDPKARARPAGFQPPDPSLPAEIRLRQQLGAEAVLPGGAAADHHPVPAQEAGAHVQVGACAPRPPSPTAAAPPPSLTPPPSSAPAGAAPVPGVDLRGLCQVHPGGEHVRGGGTADGHEGHPAGYGRVSCGVGWGEPHRRGGMVIGLPRGRPGPTG